MGNNNDGQLHIITGRNYSRACRGDFVLFLSGKEDCVEILQLFPTTDIYLPDSCGSIQFWFNSEQSAGL